MKREVLIRSKRTDRCRSRVLSISLAIGVHATEENATEAIDVTVNHEIAEIRLDGLGGQTRYRTGRLC